MSAPTCSELRESIALPGTAYAEHGKRVSIRPEPGEVIRFFRTDGTEFRHAFNLTNKPVSDIAVELRRADLHSISFVELKGRNIEDAITQLTSTVDAVQRCVRREEPRARLIALGLHAGGSAPSLDAPLRRRFEKRFPGVALRLRTLPRNNSSFDLRNVPELVDSP